MSSHTTELEPPSTRRERVLLVVATLAAAGPLAVAYLWIFADVMTWATGSRGGLPLIGERAHLEWIAIGATLGLVALWKVVRTPDDQRSTRGVRWLSAGLLAGVAAAVALVASMGAGILIPTSREAVVWPLALLPPLYIVLRRLPRLLARAFGADVAP
ncbi:MAG: hypothetical protein RQ745_03580 [Longimicrobiales bacterium]|nr:hypothetical protein [Longimicrobiales bacterium]